MEDEMDLFEASGVKLPPPVSFETIKQVTEKAIRTATPEQQEQLKRGLEACRNVCPLEE